MFPRPSLKTCENCYTWLLTLYHVYTWVWPLKPHTLGCVQKSKSFWSFPWHGSDSLVSCPSICLEIAQIWPFITPLKIYIRKPLDTLKAWENWEQRNYSPLLSELVLESASLCPLEHFCILTKLGIERWRIEVVEAQVGDSVSLIHRRANRGCIHCNI